MHILLTGGGSGGHITPLLAVASELAKQQPGVKLSYVGEKGNKFRDLVNKSSLFHERTYYIRAGKFRRYHDESIIQKIFDIKTNYLNIVDAVKTVIGVCQALGLLIKLRPDIIFIKGGFVGVPIGLAAALLRIPFITHDSDAVPGLANRIISRWAKKHATGMPVEFYKYPKDKTVFVGVPVAGNFRFIAKKDEEAAKAALNIPKNADVLFITGGSQGSSRINKAVYEIIEDLLKNNKNLYVFHHVGKADEKLYSEFSHPRLRSAAFYDNFAQLAAAATLVITRAGANTMAEFGVLAKPAIVIPSPFLANGHQLENARQLANKNAIVEIQESDMMKDPSLLKTAIEKLLSSDSDRKLLAKNLHKQTKVNAAEELAGLIIETYRGSKKA